LLTLHKLTRCSLHRLNRASAQSAEAPHKVYNFEVVSSSMRARLRRTALLSPRAGD
jgi:hypothetical protein